jgi:nitrate reductase gamma subunit
LTLISVGGATLLWRRVSDSSLRDYTNAADYAHVGVMQIATALVLAGSLDANAPAPQAVVKGLFGVDAGLHVPSLVAIGLVLMAAIFAYVPYSKMSHFIAKYFAYHSVRWDDAPNDAKMQRRISAYLALRPTWSAEHIDSDGRQTWIDIVAHNPAAPRQVQR